MSSSMRRMPELMSSSGSDSSSSGPTVVTDAARPEGVPDLVYLPLQRTRDHTVSPRACNAPTLVQPPRGTPRWVHLNRAVDLAYTWKSS